MNRSRILFLACCVLSFSAMLQLIAQSRASAHPVSQGFLEIIVYQNRIEMRAKVSVEEALISNKKKVGSDDNYTMADDDYKKHGEYLLKHIKLSADQKPLTGKLVDVVMPEKSVVSPMEAQALPAYYEFHFELVNDAKPTVLSITQDVLNEVPYAPGNSWQVTYILRIGMDGKEFEEGLLLTNSKPVLYPCDWSPPAIKTEVSEKSQPTKLNEKPAEAPKSHVNFSSLIWDYFVHGVQHIIGHESKKGWADTGYDHLLFISALVLGAATFWDLLKVVTAFTLAHTITLTLSVLDIVRLPERVVEPMIAASIVFVAVENVVFPKRSKGWGRLAAAFFFGLFHGLGFAGGLLQSMSEFHGGTVAIAIVMFSLGVEVGHQFVVVPLFAILQGIRRKYAEIEAREGFSLLAQRYGSAVISVAGLFYLYAALKYSP